MEFTIYNKKGEEEKLKVKFSSVWGNWVLAYLATMGVILGTALVAGIIIGAFN